ncbi:hypothetical protein AND4_01073 [Vibrio sp. AND4]|nr:hypothetical protein AND4_01073 [Vibrio sp. AND4]
MGEISNKMKCRVRNKNGLSTKYNLKEREEPQACDDRKTSKTPMEIENLSYT